jgi:hypothetical protein
MRLESKKPIEIYTEWTNDFATTKMMAEHYGVSVADMMAKLYEGRLAYDKKYNNDNITINKIEVATTLAHIYVEAKFEDGYLIYRYVNNDVTSYTDEAQEVFDETFDMYITILEDIRYDK